MNPLEHLHDIEGLDFISWWPLAMGWWVVIALGIVALTILIWFIISKIAFRKSWQFEIYKKLNEMEKNLSDRTAKESVIILSEYLRRIALHRFSRNECAGLAGEAWLQWLSKNDPKNFDWEKKGMLLIQGPYSHDCKANHSQIRELIRAVKNWVQG